MARLPTARFPTTFSPTPSSPAAQSDAASPDTANPDPASPDPASPAATKPDPTRARTARHSVRTHLIILIVGALLPPLLFGGFLVLRSARHEQEALAESVLGRTRVAAAAVEGELTSLRVRLFLLAGGLSLQTSDLAEFHARAAETFPGMAVVLSNAAGQEIINTDVPYGDPLGRHPDLASIRRVAETGLPHIADTAPDAAARPAPTGATPSVPAPTVPALTVNVPVTRDSRLVYVLSLDISPILPRILRQLALPERWVAAILDREGRILARNRDPERYVGQFARPDYLARIRAADQGWVEGVSREGAPIYSSFARARSAGWTVSVGIPRESLLGPVRRSTRDLALLGFAALALAAGLATVIARRIAGPVIALVPLAEAVGHGRPVNPHPTTLTEAALVARSLAEAGERLRRAAAERREADDALRDSERKYRAQAEDLARVGAERNALLDRTVLAQEEERARIARELHDSLAQYLTALRLALRKPAPAVPGAGGKRRDLESLVDALGEAVNRLAWDLRPVALDELGLRSAVEHYMEEWSERAGLPVDTEIDLGGRALPGAIEATLFRVLQEAAANVLRHAQARRLCIILEARADEVRLIVEDDGRGFAADAAPPGASRRLGLIGMRERLALVRGRLDVESGPGRGTTLFARVPLPPETGPDAAAEAA